ncbi:MAG TPA: aa3-type cytochrome c oxidase subunit IV, partial [Rhizomicrobium sp.]|nr:aa3-type cytochrome c oxidase subunit IV [Rhizomicrobium sp.]
ACRPAMREALTNHVAGRAAFAIVPPTSKYNTGTLMVHETDYQPGSMDISAHLKAYRGFLTGSKWTFGFILLIMVFLAIFRTHG